MRIISGEYRRRNLLSPPDGATTRPIPDRVKESVFSLLRGHCEGASVLDCFAGTGAIGLEAVSRGAVKCVFVEHDKRVVAVLEKNIATLGCGDRCDVARSDALGPAALNRCPNPVDLIFFDPPYVLVGDEAGWLRVKRQFERLVERLSPHGYAILRTPWPFRHGGELIHPEEDKPRERGAKGSARVRGGDEAEEEFSRWESKRGKEDRAEVEEGKRTGPAGRGGIGGRKGRGKPEEAEEEGHEVEMVQREDGRWVVKGGVGDLEGVDVDEFGDELTWVGEGLDDETGPEFTPKVDVELAMAGAQGPETHAYGNTAVHLYMKA